MDIKKIRSCSTKIKYSIIEDEKEVARAYLYVHKDDLHDEPYGLMSDVFVDESQRGKGHGSQLVKTVIEEAKKRNCYKLICTSRYGKDKVHELYKKLGFRDHGKEFRIDY